MPFHVLNDRATVTIAIQGLAVFCYNPQEKRWEIAIPRFGDHRLTIDAPGFSDQNPTVNTIQIKDRQGVPAPPRHPIRDSDQEFDRKNKTGIRLLDMDYRWVTGFTNANEIPHGTVTPKPSSTPGRVSVTMLHIPDATLYAKSLEDNSLILTTQNSTWRVDNGVPRPQPEPGAGAVLDSITEPYGFSATTVGIDILSPNGGIVELKYDGTLKRSFAQQASGPLEILIKNGEPVGSPREDRIITTGTAQYGRGDFFRYYDLFQVTGPNDFHLWEKSPLDGSLRKAKAAPEGDCNPIRVGTLADLSGLG